MTDVTQLLEVSGLGCLGSDRFLYRGLSFSLGIGQSLLVVGGNGRGKTTLINTLAALHPCDEGAIRWSGSSTFVPGGVAYLGHQDAVKLDLTLWENVQWFALCLGVPVPASPDELLAKVGLDCQPTAFAKHLSRGQQRRLAMIRLLLSDAKLWLLDEPESNLDIAGKQWLAHLLCEHLELGASVVASHDEHVAFPVTSRLRLGLEEAQ